MSGAKMNCIVSGGTGFIGRAIVERLQHAGHNTAVWTRRPETERRPGVQAFAWDPLTGEPPAGSFEGREAVLHLAGEPVAQRWNAEVKARIHDSRVAGTRHLVNAIASLRTPPRTLVCASAIGVYGDRGDEELTESSAPGSGFLAEVCQAWEAEAGRATALGVRVVKLRIGFVLGRGGGALATILPAFRWFAGGRLGSGAQWMPWIHLADLCELFVHALEDDSVQGTWNATAPHPVRNIEFTRELARAVHRPAVVPVPPLALKLAFGEFAQHMLDSARVRPARAAEANFRFRYPELRPALADLTR